MRIAAAATAALFLCATAGGASAQSAKLMTDWSTGDLKPLLTDMGMTIKGEEALDNGTPLLLVTSADGFNFFAYGGDCTGSGAQARCNGLNLEAYIDHDTVAEAEATYKATDFIAIKYNLDEKSVRISRYIIFDGGITRDNLEANIEVFTRLSGKVMSGD